MKNKRDVFISYSLRKHRTKYHQIEKSDLEKLNDILTNQIALEHVYIDIVHNQSGYANSRRSTTSPAHRQVLSQLRQSRAMLCLSCGSTSPWVKREMQLAKRKRIPRISLDSRLLKLVLSGEDKALEQLRQKITKYK